MTGLIGKVRKIAANRKIFLKLLTGAVYLLFTHFFAYLPMGTPHSVIQPLQKIRKLCCKTCSLGTPSPPLNTSPGKTALAFHFLLTSLNCCMSTLCLVYYALLLTPACWTSNNTNPRLMAFAPSLALDPTFGIHSHKTLDIAQPCHLLKPN